MSKQNKPAGKAPGMSPPDKRNTRFEQQLADSRDHDQQVKKGAEKTGGGAKASASPKKGA
jgi:hypothetical protein